MSYLSLGNPIWSCHLQILGGVRRMVLTAVIYAALLTGATFIWFRADSGTQPAIIADRILQFLAGLQLIIMVLGGSSAVHRALARDHTTRMMESLRISPMSSSTVIGGYLIGSTLQILVLFVVGALFGAALAYWTRAAVSPGAWVSGNLCVLLVAASIWSVAVFAGVGTGKPGNVTALIIILSASGSAWLERVPALGLATGAYAMVGCWFQMLDRLGSAEGFGLTMLAALATLIFWYGAAARRFRRPYLSSLDPAAALGLVALAVLVCVVGLAAYEKLVPKGWFGRPGVDLRIVFLISLLSPLLFAHLPALMAIHSRRRLLMGAAPRRRRETWPPTLWALLSAALLGAGVAVLRHLAADAGRGPLWGVADTSTRDWVLTGVAFLLAALMSCGLIKAACFAGGRPTVGAIAALLLWIAPPVMDSIRATLAEEGIAFVSGRPEPGGPSWLFGCSPPGTVLISQMVGHVKPSVWPGLAAQVGLILLALLLGRRAEQIFIRKRERRLAADA